MSTIPTLTQRLNKSDLKFTHNNRQLSIVRALDSHEYWAGIDGEVIGCFPTYDAAKETGLSTIDAEVYVDSTIHCDGCDQDVEPEDFGDYECNECHDSADYALDECGCERCLDNHISKIDFED